MVDVGTALNIASGVVLALVGGWVLSIRPRRPGNVAFAVFAIAYGLRPIPANIVYKLGLAPGPNVTLAMLLALVSAGALMALALTFPRPVQPADRRALVGAGVAGLGLGVATAISIVAFEVAGRSQGTPLELAQTLSYGLLNTVTGATLVLLSLRYLGAGDEDAVLRRQLALVSAALLSIFAFTATAGWSEDASLLALASASPTLPPAAAMKLAEIATTLLIIGLWLWNTRLGHDTRFARNVALYGAAILLAGMAYAAFGIQSGGHGIARAATVLLLAVAISRFQLLDVDVQLRWGLRSGTLAGIFVGAFFVASEAAQELVAERTGSAMIGIGAAGLLVFALTPLQRLADRVANAAVPAPYEGAKGARDAADAYRAQVTIAWRDGQLGPKEVLMLRELRDYLRLPPEEAARIEADAARRVDAQRS